MVVDQVVALLDDLPGNGPRDSFRLGSIGLSRIEPVHVLAVHGIEVRNFLQEGCDVQERHDDQRSGQARGIGRLRQLLQGDDRRVLGPVRAGDERQHGSRFGAVDDNDGDVGRRIYTGRHPYITGGSLARTRSRSTHGNVRRPSGSAESQHQHNAL